jgi:hypothetical protein
LLCSCLQPATSNQLLTTSNKGRKLAHFGF